MQCATELLYTFAYTPKNDDAGVSMSTVIYTYNAWNIFRLKYEWMRLNEIIQDTEKNIK